MMGHAVCLRAMLLLLALSGVIVTSALAQVPASNPGRECVRFNDSPNSLGDWDAQERNRKLWIEACKQGLVLEPGSRRLKSATARAYSANGDKAEALGIWRELGNQGDAAALHEIYDMYKSYYRTVSDEPQLVTRADAEAALRGAAELGHAYATWLLAVLLDRGSTVKRDAAGAIYWAQRAMAQPPKDMTVADIEARLGHFLAKSPKVEERERGISTLEKYSKVRGRGDAKAYLAVAIRKQEPGPKEEKRALSLLSGRLASDVAAVKAALGRLMIEGRLIQQNIPEGIQLVRREAIWSLETQMEVMEYLRANPQVAINRPNDFLYAALEAAELDEPGMLAAVIDLKLSDHVQFKDRDGACKLIDKYAKVGRETALSRQKVCKG